MSEMIAALSVIFVTAGLLLLIANRFSLPTVPFYILAGFLVGGYIPEAEVLDLAQWGIAFLVFVFGVGIDLQKLSTVFRDGEMTAAAQMIVLGPIGIVVGIALGFDPLNAVYFATAATLSSTLVGTSLLEIEIRNNLVHGRLAKSIHLIDDFLAILIVLVLSATAFTMDAVAAKIGYGVVILLIGLIVHRHIFGYLMRFAEGSQELLMIAAISLLIVFVSLADIVGVSPVIGAFAAGIAIRRDETETLGMLNGIESIKDFFVVIFFVTLGALVTLSSPTVVATAAALVLLTAVFKPMVTVVVLIQDGYDVRTATLTAVGLDQISEFALIIAINGLLVGRLVPELFEAIILAAAVTMITSSLTRRYDEWIFRNVTGPMLGDRQTQKIDEESNVPADLEDHVVILGYGRMGRRLAKVCETEGTPYVVVENDPAVIPDLRHEVEHYVAGDAMYDYVWSKARGGDARLVLSTVDQPRVSDRVLELATDTEVVVRTADPDLAVSFRESGAAYVIVPDLLAADRLRELLQGLLTGETTPAELRDRHREALVELEERGFTSRRPDDASV